MESGTAPRGVLPALTGARWWAAFAVFVLHALVFLPVYPFQKSELFRDIHYFLPMQLGGAGVTFFFVLSGFVIYWSFRPGTPVWFYYRRRVLKIYPTHLVAAAVFIVAAGVPLTRSVVWAPNLALVHTWIPRWTTLGGLNIPAWSLCAELLFYVSFPLALPLIRRIPARRLYWAAGLLVVAILLLHTGFYLLADGPKGIANTFAPRLQRGEVSPEFEIHAAPQWFEQADIPVSPSYWLSYTFPLSRLPEFYLGVLAARLVADDRWSTVRLPVPVIALLLAYAATWAVPVNFKMSALLVGPMAALIATLAARDRAGITGLNASRLMVWLGDISFAFYMIQFPVMVILTRLFIGGHRYSLAGWALWALISLLLSVAAAAVVYHAVDEPIMNRFARRGRAPVSAPQPPIKVRTIP